MDTVAYELRDDYKGTVEQTIDGETRTVDLYQGGVIRAGSKDVNVKDELERGKGLIVVGTDDLAAITALDSYPPLKRVDSKGAEPTVGGYETRTVTELRDELKRRGVTGAGNANRDDAVRALNALDENPADAGTPLSTVLEVADEGDDEGDEEA